MKQRDAGDTTGEVVSFEGDPAWLSRSLECVSAAGCFGDGLPGNGGRSILGFTGTDAAGLPVNKRTTGNPLPDSAASRQCTIAFAGKAPRRLCGQLWTFPSGQFNAFQPDAAGTVYSAAAAAAGWGLDGTAGAAASSLSGGRTVAASRRAPFMPARWTRPYLRDKMAEKTDRHLDKFPKHGIISSL